MSYQCQPDTSSYSINAKSMGAISSAINVKTDTSWKSFIVKPLGRISWAINVNRTLARILSTPNHWLQSCQLSMSTMPMPTQCATCSFQREPNYSLAAIKSESLYQLSIFLHVILELGFNSVITSYVLLYIK